MAKDKSRPDRPDTASALDAAQAAHAEKFAAAEAAVQAFVNDPSPATHAREIAAQNELVYCARVLAVAQNAHEAAARGEQLRAEAEAEEKRLQALAGIAADVASNLKEARSAAETIAKCMARSWDHRVGAQGLGGSGNDDLVHGLREAFFDSLISVGLNPGSIQVH